MLLPLEGKLGSAGAVVVVTAAAAVTEKTENVKRFRVCWWEGEQNGRWWGGESSTGQCCC